MVATPVPEAVPRSVQDRADVEPVEHETLDRTITGLVQACPSRGSSSPSGRRGTDCCVPVTCSSSPSSTS